MYYFAFMHGMSTTAEGRLLSSEMLKVFCFEDTAGLGTFYAGSEVAELRLGDCASPHRYRCPIDTSVFVPVRSVISASQSRPEYSLARN